MCFNFNPSDVSLEHADALSPIMVPLGAPSGMQSEDKKEALGELLRMIREDTPVLWEENLNTLLSLLMKNIGDDEVILVRSASLPSVPYSLIIVNALSPPLHVLNF